MTIDIIFFYFVQFQLIPEKGKVNLPVISLVNFTKFISLSFVIIFISMAIYSGGSLTKSDPTDPIVYDEREHIKKSIFTLIFY